MSLVKVALSAPFPDDGFSDSESDERDYRAPERKSKKISDEKVLRHLARMYSQLDLSDGSRAGILAKLPKQLDKYRVFARTLHTTLSKKYRDLVPYELGEWVRAHSFASDDWPVAHYSDPLVFLSISVDGSPFMHRVAIQLFASVVPRTAENFRQLCIGRGKLGYKGSKIHRTEGGQLVQGGDFTSGDGRGGTSIYGPQFNDENFTLHHSTGGVLSMANRGPNTQNSQFFITCGSLSSLDGKHVCFGRIAELKGMKTIIELSKFDAHEHDIVITDCGEIPKL